MRLKRFSTFLLTAAMIFSLSACSSSLEMYINVKTGEVYKYHTLTSIVSNTEIAGQNTTKKQDTTTDFKINVDNVDSEGNLTINYIYDYIKVDSDSDGTKQTYDSNSSDTSDTVSTIYKSIIGKGFTTKMTKYGEVTEVTGVDDLLNTMVESMNLGISDETYIEQTKEGFKSSFGDNALKSLVEQSTRIFPKKDIKVGTSWDIDNTINSIIEINAKTTYTLDRIEDKIAHISVKSEFKTDNTNTNDYMGLEMTADISGTMTGTIKINTKNGFLSEGDITQDMSGKMSVVIPSIQGSEEQTVDIPMDSTAKVTYSIE